MRRKSTGKYNSEKGREKKRKIQKKKQKEIYSAHTQKGVKYSKNIINKYCEKNERKLQTETNLMRRR